MSQKTSTAQRSQSGTESLFHNAYASAATKRIAINPAFLDDESLGEDERLAVLHEVFHRSIRVKQIDRLARHLAPVLGGGAPSHLLVYGPSGTGKTATVLHVLSTLAKMCGEKSVEFRYFHVDLTTPRTCFGAFNELAIAVDGVRRRYRKGIALEHIQEPIVAALSRLGGTVCVVVDEVDNVTGNSNIFYTFLAKTLPRRISARLLYVFLTNRVEWERTVDPRVLSVLKKTDTVFEPYDASDLVEILRLRVEKALDVRKVEAAALRKIAAYASREAGDARKAVELLVKAVKVAEQTSGRFGVAQEEREISSERLFSRERDGSREKLLAAETGYRIEDLNDSEYAIL